MNPNTEELFERYPLKAYKAKELSELYGVCRRTFVKWIKPFAAEIGKRKGHIYTVMQVEIIFEKLGLPGRLFDDKSGTTGK